MQRFVWVSRISLVSGEHGRRERSIEVLQGVVKMEEWFITLREEGSVQWAGVEVMLKLATGLVVVVVVGRGFGGQPQREGRERMRCCLAIGSYLGC